MSIWAGQVVDDVPVEVLEHRGGAGPARTGHAGDDQDLRLAQVGRLGGRLEGGDPGGHRDRRRLVAHASSMPAGSRAPGRVPATRRRRASAATTAAAVRSPMPCTDAISSTDAARSRLTDPKCRSSAACRAGPEARDVVEHRRRHALAAALAVRGDREPVRLVAQPLQQVEALRAALQDHRVLLPRQPHLLEPLGQPAQRDVVDAELRHRRRGGRDLRRTAVDDDEVGRVGEPRPACP